MLPASDSINDLDLNAYVDDQLDDWQRLRVEEYLSHQPEAAARVMQDMHLRRELRLAFAPAPEPNGQQRAAAALLSRGLLRDERLRKVIRLVPVAALVLAGWLANEGLGPLSVGEVVASQPPHPVVAAAISAREASIIRLPMRSQPQIHELDADELRAATGILLPQFDRNWAIRDAQIFPSPQGPGIEIVFETGDLGQISHFAVRPGNFAVTLPHVEKHDASNVAWFQIGETAHVLISDKGDTSDLQKVAENLSSSLY
ncbi:anti-sigma factor family protein [Paracoccus aestuariivivens]|uniref:Anti-sigma factor n=1 Tax=Paracoccus aestuariivivens TaxID=1820333 RepID=A0A6L6J831_9RHOB|nr:anti-sigma factor [Paracoccus aestuariivivens]MTH76879.1 anti-sigma factor [Paracoccus aestuariivivens]